jgi:hypothetical protein
MEFIFHERFLFYKLLQLTNYSIKLLNTQFFDRFIFYVIFLCS